MTRKSLPIGIQDFTTIRSEDFYYVDKTPLIRKLVEEGPLLPLPPAAVWQESAAGHAQGPV